MNEQKACLLEMMNYFHALCIKHNLRYYAVGGTMLGAARHEGFIPWDDDIDVGMPRKDYDLFAQCMNAEKDCKYVLETQASYDESFTYPYSKLYDSTTTLIENKNKELIRGVYLDIFPLDGAGNNQKDYEQFFNKIMRKKNYLNVRNMVVSNKRSVWKNGLIILSHLLPKSLFSEKKLCSDITNLCKKKDFDSCVYGGNLVGAWGWKEIMQTGFFGTPRLYKFENTEIYGVEKYDEYLTALYGNWRQLPPAEKQVSHHDYYLDLKTPYSLYKNSREE